MERPGNIQIRCAVRGLIPTMGGNTAENKLWLAMNQRTTEHRLFRRTPLHLCRALPVYPNGVHARSTAGIQQTGTKEPAAHHPAAAPPKAAQERLLR